MGFGSDSAGMLFRVKADVTDAARDLKAFASGAEADINRLTSGATGKFAGMANAIGLTSGSLKDMATGAGIATGLIIGGATAAALKFWDMAKSASDAGSQIHDLQQQTQLSTQTLSALKLAAEQGGSSFETVGAAATKFSATLVDAANGNKKLSEALARFGIDAKTAFQNPDQALSQFITKFNELPASAEKNRDEMLLFKDRTGELIPVIEQVGGNFDEFKAKLERLGLLMSQDEADAADAFGDQLTELGAVSDRVGNKFAAEFTPALTNSMRDIENALVGNTRSWINWGHQVSNVINGLRIIIRSIINAGGNPLMSILGIPYAGSEISNEDMMAEPDTNGGADQFLGTRRPRTATGSSTGSRSGNDGEAQRRAELLRAEREAQRAAAEAVRHATDEIRRDYAIRLDTLDQYRAKMEEQAQAEYDNAIKYGDNSVAAENRLNERKRDIGEFYRAESLRIAREEFTQKEAIQAEADSRTITRVRDLESRRLQTHVETEAQIDAIETAARQRKMLALLNELALAEGNLAEQEKIQAQIDLLTEKGVTAVEEAGNRKADARQADIEDQQEYYEELRRLAEAQEQWEIEWAKRVKEQKDKAKADADAKTMATGSGQFFGGLFGGDVLSQIENTQNRLVNFGQIVGSVFSGLSNAVGSVVRNFVLLGGSGTSFRKFAAEVIASLAQMAAVQALFELALGFAALFLNPPKAAAHFTAAAIFGSIAGVAAVAGRAIAGNAFKSQATTAGQVGQGSTASSAGGGSGTSGRGGDYYSSKDEESISQNRWGQMSKSDRTLTVVLKTDKGHIIDTIHENIRDAGVIRTLIQREAS